MTRAGWLVAGACVALAGVAAFLWMAESGTPGETARGRPRPRAVSQRPVEAPAELEDAGRPAPLAQDVTVPAVQETERTEVRQAARALGGVFSFQVRDMATQQAMPDAEVSYLWRAPKSEDEDEAEPRQPIPWELGQVEEFVAQAERTIADEDGIVSVPRRLGKLFAVARKDNYFGREAFTVEEDEPDGESADVLEMVADWSLTLQVLDHADLPVAGVPVALGHKTGRWSGANFTGETDAQGLHRYEHVGYQMSTRKEGTWSVRLDLLLLEPVQRELEPGVDVGETVVLRMPPVGSLAVVVQEADGSMPPDGTIVQAGIVEEGQPRDISPFSNHRRDFIRAETADGTAVYPFVELGQEFEVSVSHAGDRVHTREFGPGPAVADERREFPVTLGVKNPVLVFRAVNEAGAALPEQDLKLEMSFNSNFMSNSWDRTTRTDSEGHFRVDVESNFEDGDLRFLTVSDGAPQPRVAQVDLARAFAPGQHDLGDVVLGVSPLLVGGEVIDGGGVPIKGAEVSLQVKLVRSEGTENPDISWDRVEAKATTREDGSFELRGITPADELYVSATVEGKRGESVVARVGDANVQLVLFGTGSLPGSILLDEDIPTDKLVIHASRDNAAALPEGMYGSRADQVTLDGGATFLLDELIPGSYTIDVKLNNSGGEAVFSIAGVSVADGPPTRDPRLQQIDLRGRLFLHVVTLITPEPLEDLSGTMQVKQSGEEDAQRRWQWFHETPIEIVSEFEALDIELGVRGFRAVDLENVRGSREVELDDGYPVRLILRSDGEVPAPPYYIKAVLVPEEGGHANIDWGAPCFDESREVQARAYGTGRMKVQWLIEKRSGSGGAMATTRNVEPPQFVDVADTTAVQVFEIEISAEQLAGLTEDF